MEIFEIIGLVYFFMIQGTGVILGPLTWIMMTKKGIKKWKIRTTAAMLLAWPFALPMLMVYVYVHSNVKRGVDGIHGVIEGLQRPIVIISKEDDW